MQKDVIKEMEKYAEINSIPIMQKSGINFLCKFIEKNNIKNILEIGSAIGYSSIRMALVNDDIKVTSIEKNQERYLEAIKNIKKCDLEKRITLILSDALNIDLDGTYDLIFIDAAKAQYTKFLKKYEKNLNKDGFIISDNMNFHGLVGSSTKIESKNLRQLVTKIEKYNDFLKENDKYITKFYKTGDGIAVSRIKGE